jgi:hypothetical protein
MVNNVTTLNSIAYQLDSVLNKLATLHNEIKGASAAINRLDGTVSALVDEFRATNDRKA